jgi:hypothetical protein
MELLVKPEILTSCIYGPTFDNAESRLFLFASQCFNTESMQKVILGTVVCKHFASYQDYPKYRWGFNLVRYGLKTQEFGYYHHTILSVVAVGVAVNVGDINMAA